MAEASLQAVSQLEAEVDEQNSKNSMGQNIKQNHATPRPTAEDSDINKDQTIAEQNTLVTPSAHNQEPESHGYSAENDTQKLWSMFSLSRLPPPEPEVFSGDPLEYPGWISAFELISNKNIPPRERLHYMKKYWKGPARECIEGLFILRSDEVFSKAKALLEERYGSEYMIANSFRTKLESWPKIRQFDAVGIRKFSDFLRQCSVAMESVKGLHVLNDERQNQLLLKKLPEWLVTRWGRKAASYRSHNMCFPSFRVFSDFISAEADIMNDPITSVKSLRSKNLDLNQDGKLSARVLQSSTKESSRHDPNNKQNKGMKKDRPCPLCQGEHDMNVCPEFLKKSLQERRDFIKGKGLCFACFIPNHMSRDCRHRIASEVCSQRHPTSLHEYKATPVINMTSRASGISSKPSCSITAVIPVWLSHIDSPSNEVPVYALLDSQSATTFVSPSTMQKLDLKGADTYLKMSIMTSSDAVVQSKRYTGVVVRARDGDVFHKLPVVFGHREIPIRRDSIPTPDLARAWPHLQEIASKLMPLDSRDVGILIGYNCPWLLTPKEVYPAPEQIPEAPFAIQTALGWSLVGKTDSNLIEPKSTITHHSVTYCLKTKTKEVISPLEVAQLMDNDFKKEEVGNPLSVEDRQFMSTLSTNTERFGKRYQMPLPFKSSSPTLPNNRSMCEKRCQQLKAKLAKEPVLKNQYTENMSQLIAQGHAERVQEPEPDIDGQLGQNWYIPHHGVRQKSRPEKLRIVYDCSATYQGKSLNQILLRGPDLTCNLVGLLCRFRREPIVILCDMEQMFHQFLVRPQDRSFLRFLWWEKGDLSRPLSVYQMAVHLFGATSSPGCAREDPLPIERTLGIKWCMESDCFLFRITLNNRPLTKRSILSTVCSVFDPLGLVSPIILIGRKILQDVCAEGQDWDDPVAENIKNRWELWIIELQKLKDYKINRCFRPRELDELVAVELHHFSDASSTGFGQCTYLRLVDCHKRVHCSLVFAKARVAPLKTVTIPRIELATAVLSTGVGSMLVKELGYKDIKETYWTDSKVVLGYIQNKARRFHIYVANRVQRIHDVSSPEQWFYVKSEDSPADLSSRGCAVSELLEESNWLSGPMFLWEREVPRNPVAEIELPVNDPEVKRPSTVCLITNIKGASDLGLDITRFSSWLHIRRVVALCLHFIGNLRKRIKKGIHQRTKENKPPSIEVDELKRAEIIIINISQKESFSEELQIDRVKNRRKQNPDDSSRNLKKSHLRCLQKLDPVIDDDGLIRVGGRLKRSALTHELKHPMIISGKHYVAKLIISYVHNKVGHQGRGITLNAIRDHGFWITHGSSTVRSFIDKCVTCRRLRRASLTQRKWQICHWIELKSLHLLLM